MKTQGEWVDLLLLQLRATTAALRIIPGAIRTGNKTARTPKATDSVGTYSRDAA
jgi:hypothetical protein